jgi:hypothetical protein
MTRQRTKCGLALLLVLAAGGGLSAAEENGRSGSHRRSGSEASRPERPGHQKMDEETRAALEQVMLDRLKSALQLTPAQEQEVMPRVQRLLDSRRGYAARRRAGASHLKALLLDQTASEAEIEKSLREVRRADEEFRAHQKELRQEIDAELTPVQQAHMYLFQEHFRRAMRRQFQEAVERRKAGLEGQPRPESPGAPDDDGEEP